MYTELRWQAFRRVMGPRTIVLLGTTARAGFYPGGLLSGRSNQNRSQLSQDETFAPPGSISSIRQIRVPIVATLSAAPSSPDATPSRRRLMRRIALFGYRTLSAAPIRAA
jgi:hypothetical protein